ncbi:ABC transporter ATP-binding protein [Sorangium sp. So ce1128]
MALIELRGVAHSYAKAPASHEAYALKPLDLTLREGVAYALLGPSGCGKTTLLSIISGLLRPTAGSILIGGADVTRAPPEVRNIAQVFQFPVIYDTMTVFENLTFPLRNRGVSKAEARARALEIAALLELEPELSRRASGLPAEMKQRISLGRGLVRKDVAAILLDEPLTVIDPHLKWRLRRKLKQVHEELKVTLVYVTHDQLEALTLADEVLVMSDGRVVQQGTPEDLFERPAHTFVGYFIGSPGMNLLPCELEEGGDVAVVEGARIPLAEGVRARVSAQGAQGGELTLGVRPDFLRRAAPEAEGAVRVDVTLVEDAVGHRIVTARLGQRALKIKLPEGDDALAGGPMWIAFPPERTILYVDGKAVT